MTLNLKALPVNEILRRLDEVTGKINTSNKGEEINAPDSPDNDRICRSFCTYGDCSECLK